MIIIINNTVLKSHGFYTNITFMAASSWQRGVEVVSYHLHSF